MTYIVKVRLGTSKNCCSLELEVEANSELEARQKALQDGRAAAIPGEPVKVVSVRNG